MLRHIAAALLASAAASWALPTPSKADAALAGPPPAARAQPSSDCNDNGIEDAVDIAIGYSSDLDGNGVPDECEACGE